jgi:integrating conjugative element protein (TIGR03749 family)
MKRLNLSLMVLALSSMTVSAQAVEIMQWQRLPLAVPLTVGQERIVFVDENVRVGIPGSLKNKLRIQSSGGTLYLRASEPIEPTRLQLQNVSTGELILIDIAATEAGNAQALEPIKIVKAVPPAQAVVTEDSKAESPPRQTPIPVVLTRYAAQNLYAPLRTVERLEGVSQVRVQRDLNLSGLIPSQPIEASVLGAWQLDDHWVTAVRLQNKSMATLQLDPRALQGDFIAATFQHHNLGSNATASDTTVVYLVTRGHGLSAALMPALNQIDAGLNLPKPEERRDEK